MTSMMNSEPKGRSSAKGYVEHTAEFRRVYNLPRRAQGMPEWAVREMTEWLKQPEGTWTLLESQAQAFRELYDLRGVFLAMGVGHGKTLVSLLASEVVGCERPTLVVPACLRDKTIREAQEVYQEQFKIPSIGLHNDRRAKLQVISYEQLGRAPFADWLERRDPDMLIFDEVHKIKNRSAAVTRRVLRFMRSRSPTRDIVVVAMSGTMLGRSIKDCAHIMSMCLGPEFCPLPQIPEELDTWARAVDREVERRPDFGALKLLQKETEDPPDLESIRAALSRRISDTPGVVYTATASVEASIYMHFLDVYAEGSRERVDEMKQTRTLGHDDTLLPQDIWRHSREMALGFFYEWDPPAPPDWLAARKAWRRFVREMIGDSPDESDHDSELVVANAVDAYERGRMAGTQGLDAQMERGTRDLFAWREIKDAFKPNNVARWFSDTALQQIAASLKHPTLVWVEHRAVGERLSEILGVPYFAKKGFDRNGHFVQDWDPSKHAVVSTASVTTGFNLQAWGYNLIVTPMPGGLVWQQMMGRTHRQGQTRDEVHFTATIGGSVNRRDYERAVADAQFQQTMQQEPQKLALADEVTG